ncbi:hypothetical protein R1flu_013960 [Riccia fluitans]|uniref:CCHC-type domain-containing protein n=1 Tax=Riccia fluitans TaxID=41844 RepID=A0ABD1YI79_9MARC
MDALMREMADLKVQVASVKEKRKNPAAPHQNLWCSNCHSSGHLKDDCRLPKGAGAQVNWVDDSSPAQEETYYAEGADRQVYQIFLGSNAGPQFSVPHYNPPEFVNARPPPFSRMPNVNRMNVPIPALEVVCWRCKEKGHYANSCLNPAQ